MFNSTSTNMSFGGNSQVVKFNAPSTGILQRSNPKSIFIRFPKGSDMENMVFPSNGDNPHMHEFQYNYRQYDEYRATHGKIEIIVLQILIFGNDNYLVEVIEPKYLTEQ